MGQKIVLLCQFIISGFAKSVHLLYKRRWMVCVYKTEDIPT